MACNLGNMCTWIEWRNSILSLVIGHMQSKSDLVALEELRFGGTESFLTWKKSRALVSSRTTSAAEQLVPMVHASAHPIVSPAHIALISRRISVSKPKHIHTLCIRKVSIVPVRWSLCEYFSIAREGVLTLCQAARCCTVDWNLEFNWDASKSSSRACVCVH